MAGPHYTSFNTDITTGSAPLTVNFTDTSFPTPSDWSWDFGDGSALDTTQNPTHVYTSAGSFDVVLTATNGSGGPSGPTTITVSAPVAGPSRVMLRSVIMNGRIVI